MKKAQFYYDLEFSEFGSRGVEFASSKFTLSFLHFYDKNVLFFIVSSLFHAHKKQKMTK